MEEPLYIDVCNRNNSEFPHSYRINTEGVRITLPFSYMIIREFITAKVTEPYEDQLNHICNTLINIGYIIDKDGALDKNTHIFHLTNRYNKTFGFILARDKEDTSDGKGLYLDVVCAKIGFSFLMNTFHVYAKENNYNYVDLNSLAHVLALYQRDDATLSLGYKHRKSCSVKPNINITNEEKYGSLAKNLKAFSQNPEDVRLYVRSNGLHLFQNDPEKRIKSGLPPVPPSATIPLQKLIMDLIQKRYITPPKTRPSCSKSTRSFQEHLTQRCFEEGFKMRKCFPKSVPTRKSSIVTTRSAPSYKQTDSVEYTAPKTKVSKAHKSSIVTTRRSLSKMSAYNRVKYGSRKIK